ncbi:DUF58 domain-containing protein [Thermocrinis sp.]
MKVKVNRAGVFFIGITVFLGVSAVNTSNNLLYLVVSSLLSFMLLSGVFSLYNLRGLEIELIPPKEVYAEKLESFKVILKNKKPFPSFAIFVEQGQSRAFFPLIKREEVESLALSFPRRGLYESITLKVSSSFPVGLFERYYYKEIPLRLVVFPKPIKVEEKLTVEGIYRGDQWNVSRKPGYDQLQSVREYRGEPVKLIHWKLSAKLGKFYVKEFVSEESPPVVLSLDMVDGSTEDRVSKLAYLVLDFTKKGTPVGLRLDGTYLQPSSGEEHKRRMLRELALFGDSSGIRA